MELLENDRVRLRAQMQAYAACDDPEICEVVRNGYGDLVAYAQRVSGLTGRGDRHVLREGHAPERARVHAGDGRARSPGRGRCSKAAARTL